MEQTRESKTCCNSCENKESGLITYLRRAEVSTKRLPISYPHRELSGNNCPLGTARDTPCASDTVCLW